MVRSPLLCAFKLTADLPRRSQTAPSHFSPPSTLSSSSLPSFRLCRRTTFPSTSSGRQPHNSPSPRRWRSQRRDKRRRRRITRLRRMSCALDSWTVSNEGWRAFARLRVRFWPLAAPLGANLSRRQSTLANRSTVSRPPWSSTLSKPRFPLSPTLSPESSDL